MKKSLALLLWMSFTTAGFSQTKWINPTDAGFAVIQNQGFANETNSLYTRIPERIKTEVSGGVWGNGQHSAGLSIHFLSNAPEIQIRYQVKGNLAMPHMPATGVSGIDMYRIGTGGETDRCVGRYSFKDTIVYAYPNQFAATYHKKGFEYHIYLPMYNQVKWMEIGVPTDSYFRFIPKSQERPIVVYGTSIAHGACASRPGMAWTNIVQRNLECPLINLGFSGWGKLETGVLDFMNEQDAQLYILDCMPNLPLETDAVIYQKVIDAVKQIRSKHTTPILFIEHAGYSNQFTDTTRKEEYDHANRTQAKAFQDMKAQGVKDIYYISREELNLSPDAWVDHVHPSDLGMQRQADVVTQKIRQILHLHVGQLTTQQPVSQRRQPGSYEWKLRHDTRLDTLRASRPEAVILGNSITHYWGGTPTNERMNGPKTWNKVMAPAGFINLGYGWDYIENVLWRVYHGELDGYEAKKVVLMIGTNNLGMDTDEEIVEGIRFLMKEIRYRQPKASIKLMGIFPRRNQEKRIEELNGLLKAMTEQEGYGYADISSYLLLKNGKIDESLFLDGLHPNEKGYKKIAKTIAE